MAQGTTGSISGTVVDQNNAVIPNASVNIKGEGGQEFTVVTNERGVFRVPAVQNGNYTVTVSLTGFKKSVVNNVKVDVGTPATVDVKLEAGDVGAVVEVLSGGEVLQTQTPAVNTTLTGRQIINTPQPNRDALDLVTLLPGTAQVGRPRQSSINGLPKSALNITIDGVDVQDNLLKSSDGFFTYIRPRVDAIEEVTVSTAAGGADTGGDGAVTVKFVTRRGTNDYRGSLFYQRRHESMNSNYWFNNQTGQPRGIIRLNQFGGNFGGPIPIPNFGEGGPMFLSGKDRAFFFVNYEEFRLPESSPRQRTFLTQDAANGIFRYGSGQSANLLQIAQNAGITSTLDPTIAALTSAIRASTSQGTVTSSGNQNTQFLNFSAKNQQKRTFLALRFDVNITKKHSIENVYNRNIFGNGVNGSDLLNGFDPAFPGFPNFGDQSSQRYSNSTALRSTLMNNLVNEARFARLWGDSAFFGTLSKDMFANQGGYNLNLNGSNPGIPFNFLGLTNATAGAAATTGFVGFSGGGNGNNFRFSPTYDFTDNLTWIAGNHSLNFGGQYKIIKINTESINQLVPNVAFGIDSTDPADAVFTRTGAGATLPGATATELATAKALYALLVGRVTDINGAAYLKADKTYNYLGDQLNLAKQRVYGLYAQDSWRIRPNLTLNFGVRWQPQEGFITGTSNYAAASSFADAFGVSGLGNLFKPGTLTGKVPTFRVVDEGYRAYNTDFNNFAPSVGVVYSPNFGDSGWGRTLFGGNGESVFRAGFSRAFVREGTNVLLSILTSNPGALLDASRNVSNSTLPVGTLFRNIGSITTPAFPSTPPGVIVGTANDATNVFDPNLKTGYVDSWSVGYQRQINKDTVVEIRYVGNRGRNMWRQYNVNEYNVTENGFTNEFKLAQANLAANNAAGGARAGSYAYFGPGTGTSPLPILQAYFRGAGSPTDQTLYTSTLYRNATLINQLSTLVPNVIGFAQNVNGSAARRANALGAGLAENFFIVNPTTINGGSFVVDNGTKTSYDALQIELRRRLSSGLQLQASYTFSKSLSNFFGSSSVAARNYRTLRNKELDNAPSPYDVTHAFKLNWLYELPFGKGRMLFSDANRAVDLLLGGWSLNGSFKLQSGTPINFGNVNLVGMDRKELEKAVRKVYFNQSVVYNGAAAVYVPVSYLPTDIIQNTNLAFNNQTFTGRAIVPASYGGCIQEYVGQCGFSQLVVHGPKFLRMDLSLQKEFRFDEKRSFTFGASAYNALNNVQWRVGGWSADAVAVTPSTSTNFGRYTTGTAYLDTSTTNDQGGRTIEFIFRFKF